MGPLLLFLAALIWGTAFVAQKMCVGHLGPFAVTFFRNAIGAAFIYLCFRLRLKFLGRLGIPQGSRSFSRRAFAGGALAGTALFFASLTQQTGIEHTTPGISAFLTSNYMILVPVFGLFVGRVPKPAVWLWTALALAGTYFICIDPAAESFAVGRGEAWTLLCAVLFAMQVLAVDRFAPGTDILAFSCVQQIAGAVCALPFVLSLSSERAFFTMEHLHAALWPLLFVAVMSSGIAYTLQNLGQVRTHPALACIIMSLESAIGAITGYFILGDTLTSRQIAGCSVLLAAVILSQTNPFCRSCKRTVSSTANIRPAGHVDTKGEF